MEQIRTVALFLAASALVACGGGLKIDTDADGGDDDVTPDVLDDTDTDVPEDGAPDGEDDPTPEVAPDPVPDGAEDMDEDGDTILDVDEGRWDSDGATDTDGDTVPDFEDTDSDGDTILDADEAGDTDLATAPDDCDDDGLPNFQDTDSDDDGLSDRDEATLGTDPCDEDSDDDGFTDLMEEAYGSDPLDDTDHPGTEGDFVFLMWYEDAPSPTLDTLVFSTSLRMADIFFLMDTTGSMGGEIASLRTELSSTIIPGIDAIIEDARYGVGRFDDYGATPYGSSGTDLVFQLVQRMTSNASDAQSAVDGLTTHYGGDYPESHVPALWASATGTGLSTYLADATGCGTDEVGYPCFRTTAVPIIVMITDAQMHNGPSDANPYNPANLGGHTPPTYSEAVTALTAINARVTTIYSGASDSEGETHAEQLATDTGAVDTSGDPLVFNVGGSGTGLGADVVTAVDTLATAIPIRVDAIAEDDPSDMTDAVAAFIG
ncbi:MAG: hypothetical protein JRG91_12735, partial [Deltaproteobacteria bacterium]|nr:hypothetical protein [Deltaproteobacteria bacterium]